MRKYRNDASSTVRVEYGIELHAGLSQFVETQDAAADILAVNDALYSQQQSRLALRAPELKARAALRFAEYHVDKIIRSAYRAAEIEDGGRRGRLTATLFPDGLTPVIRPSGRAQSKPTKELIGRLVTTKNPGFDGYRLVWLPKLESALAQLETAMGTHDSVRTAYDEAFKAELALRDAHLEIVDKVMGLVRAAFPRDREAQDVIFPVMANEASKRPANDEFDRAPSSVNTA